MTDARSFDVAVLGCGLMGSALARRWAAAGLHVTAWNRTPARAQALATHGIAPATVLGEAVRAEHPVVVCLADIGAAQATLEQVPDLAGVTIVNLSDGTPDDVVHLSDWLAGRGAALLDGSPFCYPDQVGEPSAMLAYSGPAELWAAHDHRLMLLGGRSRFLSDDVASAKVLYVGSSSFFGTALAGYVESTGYLLRNGRTLEEVRRTTLYCLELLRLATDDAASAIASGEHGTDQATIRVFAHAARTAVAELEGAGHHAPVAAAVARKLTAGERAGMGDLGYSSQSLL